VRLLLLLCGCATTLRLTVAPTVDTFGHVGVDVKISGGLGLSTLMVVPTIGGSFVGTERAAALVVAPELSYWYDPRLSGSERKMPALRAGFFFTGRYFWQAEHLRRLEGVGFNFAILPRLFYRVAPNVHPDRQDFVHLGVELGGEYAAGSVGLRDRGIFSLGLTIDLSRYQRD
jgi:hypothetical protein